MAAAGSGEAPSMPPMPNIPGLDEAALVDLMKGMNGGPNDSPDTITRIEVIVTLR